MLEMTVHDDPNLPNGRLLPEVGSATLRIDLNATTPSGVFPPGEYRAKWSVRSAPTYARPVLNPAFQNVTVSPGGNSPTPTRLQFRTDLIIVVSRDAPAFKDDQYVVRAEFEPPSASAGGTCSRSTVEGGRTIKNDYLPLTQVNPLRLFLKVGPGDTAPFPVEVSNLGNGPTVVRLTVEQPFKNKLEAVNAGAEIHLESRASKGAKALFRASRTIEAEAPK